MAMPHCFSLYLPPLIFFLLEQVGDGLAECCHIGGGLKTGYHVALTVDEELCEVPLDVGILVVEAVLRTEGGIEIGSTGVVEVKATETGFALEPCIKRCGILTIDIDLVHLREGDAVVAGAESVDFLKGAWCLLAKLVAGEVEDFQPTVVEIGVERLQLLILRCEATLGGSVDNQQHLTGIICQRHSVAHAIDNAELINVVGHWLFGSVDSFLLACAQSQQGCQCD